MGTPVIFSLPRKPTLCLRASGEIYFAMQAPFWVVVLNSKFIGAIRRGKGDAVDGKRGESKERWEKGLRELSP